MTEQRTEKELLRWFEADLLPRLISENRFPLEGVEPANLSVTTLKWETSAERRNEDYFASTPYFGCLTVSDNQKKKTKDFPLIIKFIPQSIVLRESMDIDLQFYNEMVIYTQVLPTFKKFLQSQNIPLTYFDELCPYCYYANMDMENPEYGIVILEDLRQIGYKPAVSKVELDYKHCELAITQLAKFHAVSYAMKLANTKEFEALKTCFKECRYLDNRYKEETMGHFYEKSGLRAINYLLEQGDSQVPKEYLQYLRNIFTSGIYQKLRKLVQPEEPLAVITHGDFCRNNILFRLNDGEPNGCVLFDFAASRYCSPTIDLSFYFYLNTMQPFRDQYFDKLFQIYHSTIIDNVSTILHKSREKITEILPIRSFYKDFSDYAVQGYAIISFFLPVMLFPDETNLEDQFSNLTFDEMAERNVKKGGEVVTRKIADVIVDMYTRKKLAEEINGEMK